MLGIWQNIRKFGLKYSDLETMIWNIDVMMRILATNIDARNPNPPAYLYVTTTIFIAIQYYVYAISVGWFIFTRASEDRHFKVIVTVLSSTFTAHIAMVKFWFILVNQKNIQEIVTEYLEFNSRVDPSTRFGQNLNSELRIVKKRALIFGCVTLTNVMMYSITPLFRSGRHMPDDNLVFWGFDPMFKSPDYEIALCLNICAIVIIGYAAVYVSCLFIILCGYIEAYIIALAMELQPLWDDAVKCSRKKNISLIINNLYQNKDVVKYISSHLDSITEAHVANKHLVKKLEEVFQQYIGVGIGSVMIALIIDLLGGLENTYLQLPYCFMLLGMDCLSVQKMMNANGIFEKAVYDCKWENFNPANRNRVLLLLMNSQKTMKLTAKSVTTLSFETLMQITKTVYSAYTALQSTVNSATNYMKPRI